MPIEFRGHWLDADEPMRIQSALAVIVPETDTWRIRLAPRTRLVLTHDRHVGPGEASPPLQFKQSADMRIPPRYELWCTSQPDRRYACPSLPKLVQFIAAYYTDRHGFDRLANAMDRMAAGLPVPKPRKR